MFTWDFELYVKMGFKNGWLNVEVGLLIKEAKSLLNLTSHLEETFKHVISHWTGKRPVQKSCVDGSYLFYFRKVFIGHP